MKIEILRFVLLLSCCCCLSSPVPLSDDVLTSQPSNLIGRNLLQAKKPCPVNFEFMNYTIITSRCKEPYRPVNLCCQAFKEFACPYAKELDDLSNDCTSVMFSYINQHGNYPPAVFSSLCREDKVGLACDTVPPQSGNGGVANDSNNSPIMCNLSLQLIITLAFLNLLLWALK